MAILPCQPARDPARGPREAPAQHRKAGDPARTPAVAGADRGGGALLLGHEAPQAVRGTTRAKCGIESGIDPAVLRALPSYVPGTAPRSRATRSAAGSWRGRGGEPAPRGRGSWSRRTCGSSGRRSPTARRLQLRGGLQHYVLPDERVMIEPPRGAVVCCRPDSLERLGDRAGGALGVRENSYANPGGGRSRGAEGCSS